MYPVKNPARDARDLNFSSTPWAAIKLLLVCIADGFHTFRDVRAC